MEIQEKLRASSVLGTYFCTFLEKNKEIFLFEKKYGKKLLTNAQKRGIIGVLKQF
jgi:hypothetical protein